LFSRCGNVFPFKKRPSRAVIFYHKTNGFNSEELFSGFKAFPGNVTFFRQKAEAFPKTAFYEIPRVATGSGESFL
jgi:hypothetical protein